VDTPLVDGNVQNFHSLIKLLPNCKVYIVGVTLAPETDKQKHLVSNQLTSHIRVDEPKTILCIYQSPKYVLGESKYMHVRT